MRTRLRGLEIGGVQIGIEVPESCDWEWPESPIAEFVCLPRNPEVNVGVRSGAVSSADLGGETYRLGAWTFEVARRGDDWLLGLSRRGVREQLATFDREFRAGEVLLDAAATKSKRFPLRSPLDEWITLHRTVAGGGLMLSGRAFADEAHASIRLGSSPLTSDSPHRWMVARPGIFGRETVLVRESGGGLRFFATPWSDAKDPNLGYSAPAIEFVAPEEAPEHFRETVDPDEAADLLVKQAIVPLCDEALLERVLFNARTIADATPLRRLGVPSDSEAPIDWQSRGMQNAFAPPTSNF